MNNKIAQKLAKSPRENTRLMMQMVSSYSIFLLIILLLFAFIYKSTVDNARETYNSQMYASMERDVEYLEQELSIIDIYARQCLQNNSFRSIMNLTETSDLFFQKGSDFKTSLAIDIYPESLLPISEVFIYLPLTDYVVSPSQLCTSSFYYKSIRNYPDEDYDNWRSLITDPSNYYRFVTMDSFQRHSTQKLSIYIVDLNDIYFSNANALVCFVIDEDILEKKFCITNNVSELSFLSVKTKDGSLLFGRQEKAQTNNFAFVTDEFTTRKVGKSAVTYVKYISEVTGYEYICSFPAFESSLNKFSRKTILWIIALCIALGGGIILIAIFSKRNVTPIIELGEELDVVNEEKNQLIETMDHQKPILKSSYVRQLMLGTLSTDEEADYVCQYLDIPGKNAYYNAVYFVFYNNEETEESEIGATHDDNDSLAVVQAALDHFLGDAPLLYCNITDRSFAVLMTCDEAEEEAFILKIQSVVLQLHEYLLDQHSIWVFASVGCNTDSLMNIWESYQQAQEAINYATKSYIFLPYEIINKSSNAFYYPTELSTKLINFITSGNLPQVLELFNLIHHENIEERSLPVHMLKYLMSDIRNTLLKARFALPAGTDKTELENLDARFEEHLSFKLCEDIAITLTKMFQLSEEDTSLVSTIEKYIRENFKDPSLCLNKISDEFHISETYFSHMFKEKTGANFSTYLENVRMQEAMRLLKESDTNLNELYLLVGYNNATTFRRVFKKTFGVTPSSVRESNQ